MKHWHNVSCLLGPTPILCQAMCVRCVHSTFVIEIKMGGDPRVVVSIAAFHARVRGSVPGLGGLKETKNVPSPSTCESQYCGEPP